MGKILFLLFLCGYAFGVEKPLRVGMELSYPPFETICHNGEPCGISVDLVRALGVSLEREVNIQNVAFVGLILSLQNGSVDLVASSLTITEQRKRAIDFSEPYAITGLSLLLGINSPVNNIEEAGKEGRVIVVKSGTSGELYAMQNLALATIRTFDKESACILEVIQGKADAFIYDQLSVYTNWKKNPKTTRVNLVPFQKEYWAFGLKKNQPEFKARINQFIEKFRNAGGFDRLADKYLPEQKKAFAEMGVPFVF